VTLLFLFLLTDCRANEGIGEFMKPNISQRMVLDMLFYFIVRPLPSNHPP
jgi:hypothetical protein